MTTQCTTMKIKVTKWHDKDDPETLILKGSRGDTMEEARVYFDDETHLIGEEDEMEQEEFDRLPEFQS